MIQFVCEMKSLQEPARWPYLVSVQVDQMLSGNPPAYFSVDLATPTTICEVVKALVESESADPKGETRSDMRGIRNKNA